MSWNPPAALRGHALTTSDGVFLSADDAFLEIVGRDLASLRSLTILDITSAPDRARNHDRLDALRRFGKPFEIVKCYIQGDGGHVRVRNRVSLFRDGGGCENLIASVELIDAPANGLTEGELLKTALVLRKDMLIREMWPVSVSWREQGWQVLIALFVLEQQGRPSLLRDLCNDVAVDESEGYLTILQLLADGWLLLERCGEGLGDSSAALTAKGRAWMVEYLTRLSDV